MSLKKIDRYDGLLTAICFLISLSLYLRTLTPGLLSGDSGEFQTLAFLFGNTHPTGYPIYLALAKLATFLPLRDIAYRVNFFSALMAALTAASVYLAGRLLINYRILALIGALGLVVSPTFWSQAIIAEVYTAGAAFLVLILIALLWWDQADKKWMLFLAGFLGGLSIGVHMSVALLAPAVLLFLLLHKERAAKIWKIAFLGAIVGLLFTILLFGIIDFNNPTANYFNSVVEPSRSAWQLSNEMIDDPVERLLFGWSARQFRSFMFSDIANVMPKQAADYWHNLPQELGKPMIWLSILGAVTLLIRRSRVGILLGIGLTVQLLWIFNYEIWDLYIFFIPTYVLLSILSIVGMGTLMDLSMAAFRKVAPAFQNQCSSLAQESVIGLLVLGFAIYPVFQPQKDAVVAGEVPFEFDEYPVYDEFTLDVSRAVITKLPKNAIVFVDWDTIWTYYYAAHIVEGRRDLTFNETYPADDADGIAESVVPYVKSNLNQHPIFFSERAPDLLNAGFKFIPAPTGPIILVQILAVE
jgi:hypothetical protein